MAVEFLIDSSAIWRIEREPDTDILWADSIDTGEVGSCAAQRVEFRRSARSRREFDSYNRMFDDLYPDVPVPKSAWRWIEAAQYTLAGVGVVGALSPVDLMICATASARGLTVVHDDQGFETAARYLGELDVLRVGDGPNEL